MNECTDMLSKIRSLSFCVLDTALYLDAYPDCQEALCHYNKAREELYKYTAEYERTHGPLTLYRNTGNTWQWTESPWPWECEAN